VNLIYARNLNELALSTTPFSSSNRPYPNYNRVIWSDNGGYAPGPQFASEVFVGRLR
jgi:hypothetical protein